ncbi:MAG: matrixin family metalloprotease, partial [Vicinamibacterales bacterium]
MTRVPASVIRRSWAVLVSMTLVLTMPAPAFAYLKFGFSLDGKDITLRWSRTPVMYFVSDVDVPGVSSSQFQGAVSNAFNTWEAVPSASISYTFGGFTRGLPGENDGRTTLGFLDEPELDRVLASTSYLVDGETGQLLESDIFFNSAFVWSVAQAGERGRWDVESIALHEIGHLSGLGHSAIGETELASGGGRRVLSIGAVMFPIALGSGDITGRRLMPDDIAGISDLYPDRGFNDTTG